jgi:Ca2+-transporting ATPase
MESSSQKAFEMLNRVYDNIAVRVIRYGKVVAISQKDVCVGDVILIESGDKIIADGRLIESNELAVDESALTGESVDVKKNALAILNKNATLAERVNCVYSGTFVKSGSGKMIVTAVGDKTEIGSIAEELLKEKETSSPLQSKLSRLGKIITIIGIISAVLVFGISVVRLALMGQLNFESVQDLFISSIVLIVAAVPEGLPTIVAVSLALNMIKLAKGNALIKKMSATETAGAVSVICSDKTGTLTQNKMSVVSVCVNEQCLSAKNLKSNNMFENFVLNNTADIVLKGKCAQSTGSATECALLTAYQNSNPDLDYLEMRSNYKVIDRKPFSSDNKYMTTTILKNDKEVTLLKGAPEKVVQMCNLSTAQKLKVLKDVQKHQKKARRVLCFAHAEEKEQYIYDGFVAIADPIRKDVIKAVNECKSAGIKIKMLTGDNMETALAIAKELKMVESESEVVNAGDIEKLSDEEFCKVLNRVSVIARSTPTIKLRVVKMLKSMGEVVAVTGDGINDAPAIKQADVGIAMGVSGSEITKEAADVVLLDDSFSTVVSAIAFGRNVYKNLQRFILFQLSVNLSALLFITVCAIINMPAPFNTMQLLWINLIMDGPPALTLGLERAGSNVMLNKPVKRSAGIVGLKMLLRIVFNGLFVGCVMLLQYRLNFLGVKEKEKTNALFTLFILFQLLNAFNSRELGAESIFKNIGRNKVMVFTFVCVFILHFVIVQCIPSLFGVSPMGFICWIKVVTTSFSIIIVSELYKAVYRALKQTIKSGFMLKKQIKYK